MKPRKNVLWGSEVRIVEVVLIFVLIAVIVLDLLCVRSLKVGFLADFESGSGEMARGLGISFFIFQWDVALFVGRVVCVVLAFKFVKFIWVRVFLYTLLSFPFPACVVLMAGRFAPM